MAHDFETFSLTHAVVLALFLVGIPVVVRLGRWARQDAERTLRVGRVYAVLLVVVTGTMQVVQLLPGEYDVDTSLPLNLCDIAWVVAAYALWTSNQLAASLTYYWGLVLSTQGLITPDLHSGLADVSFYGFWAMHFLIVWSAIYLVWGLGIRPSWHAYRVTVVLTLVWVVSAYLFNVTADTNYGFLNRKPTSGSLLDFAGPWPIYVVVETAVVAAVWALMTWPWTTPPQKGDEGRLGAAGDRARS